MTDGLWAPFAPRPAEADLPEFIQGVPVSHTDEYDGVNVRWWKITATEDIIVGLSTLNSTKQDGTAENGDMYVAMPIANVSWELISGEANQIGLDSAGSRQRVYVELTAGSVIGFYALAASVNSDFTVITPAILIMEVNPFVKQAGDWETPEGEEVITVPCTPSAYVAGGFNGPEWYAVTQASNQQGNTQGRPLAWMNYYYYNGNFVSASAGCTWDGLNRFSTGASTDYSVEESFSDASVWEPIFTYGTRVGFDEDSIKTAAAWAGSPPLVKKVQNGPGVYAGQISTYAHYQTPATWPQINRYSYGVYGYHEGFIFRPDQAQYSEMINLDYADMSVAGDTEWDMEDRTITKIEVIADTFGPDKPWGTNINRVRIPDARSDEAKVGWYVGLARSVEDTVWGPAEGELAVPDYFNIAHAKYVTGPAGPQSLADTDTRISGLTGSQSIDTAWHTVPDSLLQAAYTAGSAAATVTTAAGLRFTGIDEHIIDGTMAPQVHGGGWYQDPFMWDDGSGPPSFRPLENGTFQLITDYTSSYKRKYCGLSMRFTVRHRRRRPVSLVPATEPPEVIDGLIDQSRRLFT